MAMPGEDAFGRLPWPVSIPTFMVSGRCNWLLGGTPLVAGMLLLACAHTYGLDHQMASAERQIGPDASFYVAMPAAGRFETQEYPLSGQQTQDAIVQALRPHVAEARVGLAPEDHEAALRTARGQGVAYALVPAIEHWEDRATEWSGRPDRVIIDIRILEVASGEVVDAAEVSGKSRWATLGGDHPQELLPRAVGDYVAVLFQ